MKKNANRIVDGFEFQQAEADGRTAWRVMQLNSPPLTPSPPSSTAHWKSVTGLNSLKYVLGELKGGAAGSGKG